MAKELSMRYGCNPNQGQASLSMADGGPLPLEILNGAPSYINVMDALNSWQLVCDLSTALSLPAATSFKHVSPAGAAVAVPLSEALKEAYFVDGMELSPLATAYARARGADRLAAFGDWVALSEEVDESTAQLIKREVSDGVIAPAYSEAALKLLTSKKSGAYPVFLIDPNFKPPSLERRELFGITLQQARNTFVPNDSFFANIETKESELSSDARRDLIVATITVKYTQSNSVCLAYDGQVIGNGAGQQSRVHCVRLAASKADNWYLRQHPHVRALKFRMGLKRAERINAIDLFLQDDATPAELVVWEKNFAEVPQRLSAEEKRSWMGGLEEVALSSDAFFPFRDNLDRAYRSGVRYVAQAGGSIQDKEVTAAADEYGMVMIHTGVRLFHH